MNLWTYRKIKKLLNNQSVIQESLDRIEVKIMGLKEDFNAFVASVNERTNEISAALEEIKLDIEALKNPQTPADLAAAVADVQLKLSAVSTTAAAIAADDTVVVPPPIEPL